ncbi:CIA30 family protein [Altericista sp. CCNU0014]|uniref:CIA30 family protein n=1 Tax=Altericista sp. CCNU0014 TaxID=3082949 RepID=UPI00384D1EB5
MSEFNKSAWDFSRFIQTLNYFEAIPLLSWVQKMFSGSTPPPAPQPQAGIVFDFRASSTPLSQTWGALDDVVMGGVSASTLQQEPEGALFTGYVSTANSGGFASARTRNFEPPLNVAGYAGLELSLKGDGKRYKFLTRDEDSWDSVAYAYSFDTTPGIWKTVRIPFADLVPVFRAKTVKNGSSLNTSRIRSLQLMLSKFEYDGVLNPHFEPGSFTLLVQSIGAYL